MSAPQPLAYFPGDFSHLPADGLYYFGEPPGFDMNFGQPLHVLPTVAELPEFPPPEPAPEPRLSALHHLIIWLVVAAAFVALAVGAIVYCYSLILPDPRVAALTHVPPNLKILAASGAFIAERGMRRDYVTHDRLPRILTDAVMATEDRRFPYHFGFDPAALARAFLKNRQKGEIVQGGSTITQQLAKNLYLAPARSMRRKVGELFMALWLEAKFSKNEIMELYLNRVYFGSGNYGIGAAAYHYFNKKVENLTLPEAALLVGLIKAPSYFASSDGRDEAYERTSVVLTNMLNGGYIDEATYRDALAKPAVIHPVEPPPPGFEFVTDWITELVPSLVGEVNSNLTVETSLDFDLQRQTDTVVKQAMERNGANARAEQAAVVVLTPDGGVKALFGGMDYQRNQFNRAVKARRQPGSAFKPFVYLAALETGLTPDSLVDDEQTEVEGWTAANFGSTYRGRISLKEALAQSSNAAAVRLMIQAGSDKVIETAHRLGISSKLDVGPSLALGTAELTLLEITGSYASFANDGIGVLPYIITRVRDDKGRVLYERNTNEDRRVMTARNAGLMNEMLNAVVTSGTGSAAALHDRPAAGKTGTTSGYRDAWFIGYTADYVAGVWVGNDRHAQTKVVTGGGVPAGVWREIMEKAHKGLPVRPLPGTQSVTATRETIQTLSSTEAAPAGGNVSRQRARRKPQ